MLRLDDDLGDRYDKGLGVSTSPPKALLTT